MVPHVADFLASRVRAPPGNRWTRTRFGVLVRFVEHQGEFGIVLTGKVAHRMTEIHQIEQELRQFLNSTRRFGSSDTGEAPEIRSALTDRELRTRMAEFIRDKWNVAVSDADLTAQHLQTTECVARLITAKALGSRGGGVVHCRELDAFRHISRESTDGGRA